MAASRMKKVPHKPFSKRVEVERGEWYTESKKYFGGTYYFVSGSHTIRLDKSSSGSVLAKRTHEEMSLMGVVPSGEKKTVVLMHIRKETSGIRRYVSASGAQINLVEGGTYNAAGGLVIKVKAIGPKSVTFDLSMSK